MLRVIAGTSGTSSRTNDCDLCYVVLTRRLKQPSVSERDVDKVQVVVIVSTTYNFIQIRIRASGSPPEMEISGPSKARRQEQADSSRKEGDRASAVVS